MEKEKESLKILVSGARRELGKTTLALNLALGFSQLGYRAFLLDIDPSHSENHLEALELEGAGVEYIQSPGDYNKLLNQSRFGAQVIIIDPGRLVNFSKPGLVQIDIPIIVSTSQLYSLTESYAFAKMLAVSLGLVEVFLVVNRVRGKVEALERLKPLFQVSERFFSGRLNFLGLVSEVGRKRKRKGFPLLSSDCGERFNREVFEILKKIQKEVWGGDSFLKKEVK